MSDVDAPQSLSALKREILEYCSVSGETTTTLDEELLTSSPGRATVGATLRGLFAGVHRPRDAEPIHRIYEDDWLDVTQLGREALGLPPARSIST